MNRYLTRCHFLSVSLWLQAPAQAPVRQVHPQMGPQKKMGLPLAGYCRAGTMALGVLITGLFQLPTHSQESRPAPAPSQPAPSQPAPSQPAPQPVTQPEARPLLQVGSQGTAVAELQAVLTLLGYYSGTIDGVYQESTAEAVAAFQRVAGLQPDGVTGAETWNRLLPVSPPLSQTTAVTPAAASATPRSAAPAPSAPAAAPQAPVVSQTPQASQTPQTPQTSQAPQTPQAPSPTPAPAATNFPTPTLTPSPSPAAALAPSPAPAPAPTPTPAPTPVPSSAGYTPVTPTPTATVTTAELPVLRLGMQGAEVTRLQEQLKALGLFPGVVDGVFGAETQAAVQEAQRNYNLEPDGVVGSATWEALLQRR